MTRVLASLAGDFAILFNARIYFVGTPIHTLRDSRPARHSVTAAVELIPTALNKLIPHVGSASELRRGF